MHGWCDGVSYKGIYGRTYSHSLKKFLAADWNLYMDLPQKNLPQHRIKRGGRTYAIVEALTMQVMDAYMIVCSDEYYADEVSGPYLTYEEALADLESAADRNEMINERPI